VNTTLIDTGNVQSPDRRIAFDGWVVKFCFTSTFPCTNLTTRSSKNVAIIGHRHRRSTVLQWVKNSQEGSLGLMWVWV